MALCDWVKSVTVEPVLFLYMLAIYMQYGIFQDLVYEKVCITTFNSTVCHKLNDSDYSANLDTVQKDSSMWILSSTVSLALPSIISANFLGSWGDSFGRKLPLIMPSIGGILSSFVYIWISLYNLSGPVWPIVIASALSGVFGGFVSCIMAVTSYISNVSSQRNRTARVSLLEAMSFLGGTIGPFAGGGLLSISNHATVFGFICGCHVLLIVYVLLFVPQVMGTGTNTDNNSYCSFTHVKDSITTCFKKRDGLKRAHIICFLASSLLIMTTTAGEMDVAYLFAKDDPLKWTYQTYSYYSGVKFALGSLTLILATPVVKYIKIPDHIICLIGIISKAAGFVLLGYSTTTTLMFLAPLLSMFSSFCIPAIRSLLSKHVETWELGKMYAFVASVENICTLLGSVIFNSLYPIMRDYERGLIFYFAATLQIIPLIIMWWSFAYKDDADYVDLNLEK
ncbi:proton-coupled folate transporter-like [Periplaneta americana]|uniref:proton-coupled folate transporter-like n=1 Tax=Periplaneta americana TaxID=6978 RepID=UPI0037E70218